jgi:hypothetical protein
VVGFDLFELDGDVCEWNDGKEEKQWAIGLLSKRLNTLALSRRLRQ